MQGVVHGEGFGLVPCSHCYRVFFLCPLLLHSHLFAPNWECGGPRYSTLLPLPLRTKRSCNSVLCSSNTTLSSAVVPALRAVQSATSSVSAARPSWSTWRSPTRTPMHRELPVSTFNKIYRTLSKLNESKQYIVYRHFLFAKPEQFLNYFEIN